MVICLPKAIDDFLSRLCFLDRFPNTANAYKLDLLQFAEWREETNGDELPVELTTATDLREFRHWLVGKRQALLSTANRGLATLRSFLKWARANGVTGDIPRIPQPIEQVQSAPKALDRGEQNSVIRAVERYRGLPPEVMPAVMWYGAACHPALGAGLSAANPRSPGLARLRGRWPISLRVACGPTVL